MSRRTRSPILCPTPNQIAHEQCSIGLKLLPHPAYMLGAWYQVMFMNHINVIRHALGMRYMVWSIICSGTPASISGLRVRVPLAWASLQFIKVWLLGKLEHYGICVPCLKWIQEFLTGRTQSVLCDGVRSGSEHVLFGVPQGTVLGLVLFLLHINEMPSVVDPHTQCLYRVVDSWADQLQLQQDLPAPKAWASDWGMHFNASKCHVMVVNKGQSHRPFLYQLCGTILDSVPPGEIPRSTTPSINVLVPPHWQHSRQGPPEARIHMHESQR